MIVAKMFEVDIFESEMDEDQMSDSELIEDGVSEIEMSEIRTSDDEIFENVSETISECLRHTHGMSETSHSETYAKIHPRPRMRSIPK